MRRRCPRHRPGVAGQPDVRADDQVLEPPGDLPGSRTHSPHDVGGRIHEVQPSAIGLGFWRSSDGGQQDAGGGGLPLEAGQHAVEVGLDEGQVGQRSGHAGDGPACGGAAERRNLARHGLAVPVANILGLLGRHFPDLDLGAQDVDLLAHRRRLVAVVRHGAADETNLLLDRADLGLRQLASSPAGRIVQRGGHRATS